MITTQRPASTEITLDEEVSFKDKFRPPHYTGRHFMEETAFLITGETDECDVAAVSLTFNVDGEAWGGEPACLQQTNFMAVPKSQRGKGMTDNDFTGCRCDPVHPLPNFGVDRSDDSVVWRAGDLRVTAQPPYWSINGGHLVSSTTFGWADSAKRLAFSGLSATSGTTGWPASNGSAARIGDI